MPPVKPWPILLPQNGTSSKPIPSSSSLSAHQQPRPPPISEIIPRLWISDLSSAEDAALISSLGITHVISAMRGSVVINSDRPLHRVQIPLEDNPFAELAAHLPSSTAFIIEAMKDPNARVLVHCAEGISRSVSIVCAYLMHTQKWTPTKALMYVKSKRTVADPNFGFVKQLHEYERTLQHYSGDGPHLHGHGRGRGQ